MHGPTFPFAPMKTYGPISVNLREKLELLSLKLFFSSPFTHLPFPQKFGPPSFDFFFPLSYFPFFLIIIFKIFFIWTLGSHCAMCPSLIRVCYCPTKIYLFSVQFILNKLSLSHFLTSEIFIKISSLESLATYHPENRKNF